MSFNIGSCSFFDEYKYVLSQLLISRSEKSAKKHCDSLRSICIVIRDPVIKRTPLTDLTRLKFLASAKELDSKCHISWPFFFSMVRGERWFFILLVLVDLFLQSLFNFLFIRK